MESHKQGKASALGCIANISILHGNPQHTDGSSKRPKQFQKYLLGSSISYHIALIIEVYPVVIYMIYHYVTILICKGSAF